MAKTARVSLTPQTLDLSLYAGDGAALQLTVTDPTGTQLELTGTIAAQIRQRRSDAEPVTSFAVEIDAPAGVAFVRLTGEQTSELLAAGDSDTFTGVWDCQWTPASSEPVTLLQGAVDCTRDVTRA